MYRHAALFPIPAMGTENAIILPAESLSQS